MAATVLVLLERREFRLEVVLVIAGLGLGHGGLGQAPPVPGDLGPDLMNTVGG